MEQGQSLFNLFDKTQTTKAPNDKKEERKASNLFRRYKTIRDAIHGDIWVTRLEVAIMDTEEFQRLRKIRQLGPTNLVYPCANHTRFDHSLGTLCMAQRLIDLIKTNPYPDPDFELKDDHTLLIRVCALVHDLAHVPFGHTIEDEGNLAESQWADKSRIEYFLGNKSTIGSHIIDVFRENDLDGERFLGEVRSILSAHTEEVEKLNYPFAYDIVQNTICADLLDYIHRDLYFCGLREAYDPRFLSFFYITSYKDKWRLVLRLIRPKEQTLRRDVISETLHLLRLRYSLAEKIYYHHAKVKASAMIVSAIGSALKNRVLLKEALWKLGDDELLSLVTKDKVGGHILEKLKSRKLYEPVYRLSFVEERLGSEIASRRKEIIEKFRNPIIRHEAERTLENMNFLDLGQVIVYCPGPEMGQKVVKTLVEWKNGKSAARKAPLSEVPDARLKQEIKTSIEDKHLELWNMYVFVDPGLNLEQKQNIASDCTTKIIGETNEMVEFCQVREDYLQRYEEKAEQELGVAITGAQMRSIREASSRYEKGRQFFSDILTYENFKDMLRTFVLRSESQ